jgi:hypothetical protein
MSSIEFVIYLQSLNLSQYRIAKILGIGNGIVSDWFNLKKSPNLNRVPLYKQRIDNYINQTITSSFWVSRDLDSDCVLLWDDKPELLNGKYMNNDDLPIHIKGHHVDIFFRLYGYVPKMGTCKKVTITVQEVE